MKYPGFDECIYGAFGEAGELFARFAQVRRGFTFVFHVPDADGVGAAEPSSSDGLPASLDTRAIKVAIDQLKPKFDRCVALAKLPPMLKIPIKFEIAGATGAIVSLEVRSETAYPGLDACFQTSFREDVVFTRFARARQSFTFNFRTK
jgi:hypothetical protein